MHHHAMPLAVKTDRNAFALSNLLMAAFLALLLIGSSTAEAAWGSGYFKCVRTALIDFDVTITDAAINTPELSTLTELVVAADLAGALADESKHYTVFAPVNGAFDNLPTYLTDGLGANPADLTAVLLYHVVPYRFDPRKVAYIRQVNTLAGQTLFVNRDRSGPQVNQSNVDCQGVRTKNGDVYFVDSVLLPQF